MVTDYQVADAHPGHRTPLSMSGFFLAGLDAATPPRRPIRVSMPQESFAHDETRQLFATLEEITRRSTISRGQAYEDVIRASVCALAAEILSKNTCSLATP